MIKDVVELLTDLGLSDSEAKVYLASLELGPTSVQKIAKKADYSRTATYDIIDSLQEKSLMSSYEQGKKRFFAAEDPDNAVLHFKDRVEGLKSKLNKLENKLPEVEMMAGGDRPTVRFYEGEEAVMVPFHDVKNVNPDILYEVTDYAYVRENFNDDDLNKVRKHTEGIPMKILYHGELTAPRPYQEYCQLLPDLDKFEGDIWIYADRVAFITFFGKTMTVLIESQPLADVTRVLFEAAWRICGTHHEVMNVEKWEDKHNKETPVRKTHPHLFE
jgi:sugar-specific transcriptional regulator TrmB